MPSDNFIAYGIHLTNNVSLKFKLFLGKRLKGAALYIAILVSILIGIILSLLIMISNFNQRSITLFTQNTQLYYNLQSAFQIAQSGYFTEEMNNVWIKNEANDDSIRVKKIYWGAYFVISSETKNRHQSLSQSGIYGTQMTADTGLMVSDNSRPVGLSGAIIFKANCYLPKAGIKPAYIEGQSYISDPQTTAFIKSSPQQIPEISSSLLKGLKHQQQNSNDGTDSSVSFLPNVFTRTFSKVTVVWRTSLPHLSQLTLKNNIKIICENVEIDSTCHFENVLIVCNKIHFKNGFNGKIHVLASDSIICEKECIFNYPSSFVLLPDDESSNGLCYIQLNEGCRFTGGIVACNNNSGALNTQKVFIKLNAKSEVNGFLYSSDYLHAEGIINATVICNKLLLKTASAVYENHLLGCEVNPQKYAQLLAVPIALSNGSKLMCCEKLN